MPNKTAGLPDTIYVATSNPGKLRDFALAASNAQFQIAPLPGLAVIPAPPEDEPTFEGNARAKAVSYSRHAPGQLVLADDSGLEVDALHGAPGVRSARYADDYAFDPEATDVDGRNNGCLLQALNGITNRQARYRCVLAAARDGQTIHLAGGAVEGEILYTPRGTGGFGYDPLFFLPSLQQTMAELDPATRLALSHRGQALRNLLQLLASKEERRVIIYLTEWDIFGTLNTWTRRRHSSKPSTSSQNMRIAASS